MTNPQPTTIKVGTTTIKVGTVLSIATRPAICRNIESDDGINFRFTMQFLDTGETFHLTTHCGPATPQESD